MRFPVCKPKLPSADMLLPYLRQIDDNRFYSNFGPLVRDFESRFAALISAEPAHVTTTSSGMSALELAIRACDLPAGSYAMVPSWTFCATAHAIVNAGLKPFFVDVDRESWALTPEIAVRALANAPGDVSLVLPVVPFGVPLPMPAWEDFARAHNVQVVIDGATLCPEDITPSKMIPIMVSLHATKVLNAGEGGVVIWADADRIAALKNMSGFGLLDPAGISVSATNAKMSEYHAAIALASLDAYEDMKADFMRIAARYHQNFEGSAVWCLSGYGTDRYNSFCLVTYDGLDIQKLHDAGIETRAWWRKGCHAEPLFAGYPRMDLPNTAHLATHSIGLPCSRDLDDDDIDRICEIVIGAAA